MKILLVILSTLAIATVALAQPVVSIQFEVDKSPVGPSVNMNIGEFLTAYVVVDNADMMVGGVAFKLEDTGSLLLVGQTYPSGVVIGDLMSGVEIGFTDPIPQFDSPAVVATLTFLATALTIQEIWPMPHPTYGEILVGDATGQVHLADSYPGTVFVGIEPEIGLFFNAEGTDLDATFIGGPDEFRTVYLMIRDLDVPIVSAFLSLDLPPSLSLTNVTLPPGVTASGDWMSDMVLTFDPPLEAFGSSVGLMAELEVCLGTAYLDMEPLTVGGRQDYAEVPLVYTGFPRYYAAVPLMSTISIPIDNEDKSWGQVKTLFR